MIPVERKNNNNKIKTTSTTTTTKTKTCVLLRMHCTVKKFGLKQRCD
jgi:hypothetical protein